MESKTVHISIDGMSCGHCVKTVRQALESVQGVQVRSVEIGRAVVDLDETVVEAERVAEAIEERGFAVRSMT